MKMKYADVKGRPFLLVPVIDERLKKVPLDPVVTLVFGFLVFLARKGNTTSRTAVSRYLRLDKKATDRSVRILIEGGCVIEDGRRIRAVDPQGESSTWFRRLAKPTGEEWYEQLIYDYTCLPRSTSVLSVRTNALFWHLMKLGYPVDSMPGYHQVGGTTKRPPPFLTVEYLANGLRCYRKTIARGLKRLVELDLIRIQHVGQRRFGEKQKRFVVGIPPIGASADLWRNSWSREGQKQADTEVTAESLFGMPSQASLVPSKDYDEGLGQHIRAFGIKGKVANEVVTKIVKYRIERREWQSILSIAHRDHNINCERDPDRYRRKDCGNLFKYMLDEFVKQRRAHDAIRNPSAASYAQMEVQSLLASLKFTRDAFIVLREAVDSEHFDLDDGGCVPCRLDWDIALDLLKQAGQDSEAFKRSVAESIFDFRHGTPKCEWLGRWLNLKPMPQLDSTPLSRLGFGPKESKLLLQHAKFLVRRTVRDDDPATLNQIVNNLVRVACWQGTKNMMTTAMEGLMNDIGGVLDRTNHRNEECETDPEEVRATGAAEVDDDCCFVG